MKRKISNTQIVGNNPKKIKPLYQKISQIILLNLLAKYCLLKGKKSQYFKYINHETLKTNIENCLSEKNIFNSKHKWIDISKESKNKTLKKETQEIINSLYSILSKIVNQSVLFLKQNIEKRIHICTISNLLIIDGQTLTQKNNTHFAPMKKKYLIVWTIF